jgi:hypothetical protein
MIMDFDPFLGMRFREYASTIISGGKLKDFLGDTARGRRLQDRVAMDVGKILGI